MLVLVGVEELKMVALGKSAHVATVHDGPEVLGVQTAITQGFKAGYLLWTRGTLNPFIYDYMYTALRTSMKRLPDELHTR